MENHDFLIETVIAENKFASVVQTIAYFAFLHCLVIFHTMADSENNTQVSKKKEKKNKKKKDSGGEVVGSGKKKSKADKQKTKAKAENCESEGGEASLSNHPQDAGHVTGMQADDFHETPSCFSSFSNPLKKKQGYSFESSAERYAFYYSLLIDQK